MKHTWQPVPDPVLERMFSCKWSFCTTCGLSSLAKDIPLVKISCGEWLAKKAAQRILGTPKPTFYADIVP